MKAALSTLIYTDLFFYPLKTEEIWRFLIGEKKSQKYVTNNLQKLKRKGLIEEKAGYFFLKNSKGLVSKRKKSEQEAAKKIRKIKKILPILKKLPFLKAMALTGGVACANVKKEDDIDLLVVVQNNRLWLVRPILVLLLEFLGIRRRPGQKRIQDKICLNILLEEKTLSLPKNKQNLFTAFEIAQMKFLWEKDELEKRFFEANKWVRKFLPNLTYNLQLTANNKKQKIILNCLIAQLLNCFNLLLYKLQLFYMKKRRTKEQVGLHFAFFHPQDKARKVLDKYKEKITSI